LLILNYPHNPTGAILEPKDLAAIAKLRSSTTLLVITDEIYADLTYGKKPCSIASFPGMKERTLYISGFSKAFAMTGWRLGYVCGPADIITTSQRRSITSRLLSRPDHQPIRRGRCFGARRRRDPEDAGRL
jgi:aspartate/methionine/tyrosine aminotransferase